MHPAGQVPNLELAERRSELGGVATRCLDLAGEGTPFLLIHGFADSADTWRPLLRELGRAGRAATALDLRGFATAEPLAAEQPLLEQWDPMVADAIRELSAAHGDAGVYVAGNSLGGCLALRAAEREELPVAGIVPIAPAGLEMARWFSVIEGERIVRLLRRVPIAVPEPIVRELVGRVYSNLVFADASRVPRDAISSFTGHLPTIERSSEVLEIGRRMLTELESPFRLERVDCPLLLVWGEQDRMVFTGGAERVLRVVPYSDMEIIPGCGHCPQVEMPERLAEILLAFPHAYEHP